MLIGNRLKEIRNKYQLTQKELAKLTGISLSSIISYENNLREPKVETLDKLSKFFSVDNYYFNDKLDNTTLRIMEEKNVIGKMLSYELDKYLMKSFEHSENTRHYTNGLISAIFGIAEKHLSKENELIDYISDDEILEKLFYSLDVIEDMEVQDIKTLINIMYTFCNQPKYRKS